MLRRAVTPPDKDRKPGEVREGRIPIYDHKGHMRGHVGPKATSVTVSRFTNMHGSKLTKRDGRDAWVSPAPPPKPKPKIAQQPQVAAGAGGKPQSHKLEISLQQAKGSASKAAGKSGAKS